MITLNYRDARPIYEQVRNGLRRLIVSGAIADGEKLPSVRALPVSSPSTRTPSSARTASWNRRATPRLSRERAASPCAASARRTTPAALR